MVLDIAVSGKFLYLKTILNLMKEKNKSDKDLIFLRDKIAEYLRQERADQKIGRVGQSRELYEGEMRTVKKTSLENLCRELRLKGYTREDVEEVISRYKDEYNGQIDGAGLIGDAGGRRRFWREMREILRRL